jgi:DNA modification methylase
MGMKRLNSAEIIVGNALDEIKNLPSGSVDCCVTSPPYWGLRDYGTGSWQGGDESCNHYRDTKKSESTSTGHKAMSDTGNPVGDAIYKSVCEKCGATRVDEQLGLEKTPEEYVSKMVDIFREVKRVLRDDGTLWLNLGDTYSGSGKGSGGTAELQGKQKSNVGANFASGKKRPDLQSGLKAKDLVGIPWMVAFALRSAGWYLRQDIIWHKPNPMPEPVKDRCVKGHEYIFLLSKSKTYYFDHEAIKEPSQDIGEVESVFGGIKYGNSTDPFHQTKSGNKYVDNGLRSKRSVWTVPPSTYKGAHFATFPPSLIEPCIKAGSRQDGIVLDPFSGSGTTGEVSLKLGRDYIGIELNSDYAKMSMERIEESVGTMFCGVSVVNKQDK